MHKHPRAILCWIQKHLNKEALRGHGIIKRKVFLMSAIIYRATYVTKLVIVSRSFVDTYNWLLNSYVTVVTSYFIEVRNIMGKYSWSYNLFKLKPVRELMYANYLRHHENRGYFSWALSFSKISVGMISILILFSFENISRSWRLRWCEDRTFSNCWYLSRLFWHWKPYIIRECRGCGT